MGTKCFIYDKPSRSLGAVAFLLAFSYRVDGQKRFKYATYGRGCLLKGRVQTPFSWQIKNGYVWTGSKVRNLLQTNQRNKS